MDEDIDEEGEGTIDLVETEHTVEDHKIYRDAFGNYVVIVGGDRIVASSLDELKDEVQKCLHRKPNI